MVDAPEPKAILRTEVDNDADLEEVTISNDNLPHILSSLLDDAWSPKELHTLLQSVDEEGRGKLDLSRASQVILHFLKKSAERKEAFSRVSLRISTQIAINGESGRGVVILSFYPQVTLDPSQDCLLQ